MIRLNNLWICVIAFAGLVVLSVAEPARASEGRFKGYIQARFANPPGYPGPFAIVENNYSKVSPLGRVSGWITVNVAPDGSRSGNIFLKNDQGSLSLTFAASPTGLGNIMGQFTIVSGTGKYEHARGGGEIGQVQFGGPAPGTDIFTGFDGWISF